jgi:hypothetical protein
VGICRNHFENVSLCSKKYAKVHEKAPKLKIQEPNKNKYPNSETQSLNAQYI